MSDEGHAKGQTDRAPPVPPLSRGRAQLDAARVRRWPRASPRRAGADALAVLARFPAAGAARSRPASGGRRKRDAAARRPARRTCRPTWRASTGRAGDVVRARTRRSSAACGSASAATSTTAASAPGSRRSTPACDSEVGTSWPTWSRKSKRRSPAPRPPRPSRTSASSARSATASPESRGSPT